MCGMPCDWRHAAARCEPSSKFTSNGQRLVGEVHKVAGGANRVEVATHRPQPWVKWTIRRHETRDFCALAASAFEVCPITGSDLSRAAVISARWRRGAQKKRTQPVMRRIWRSGYPS